MKEKKSKVKSKERFKFVAMNLGAAEIYTRQQLQTIYEEREASNIAALVLEQVTGLTRLDRITKKEEKLSTVQLTQLNEYLQRLIQHEPVQYVLNKAWFYGLELFVNEHVLIPRPETEELVEWIVNDVIASGKDVFKRKAIQADETTQLKILDVGTGSGCIALALKKQMPKAEVWACDASDEALNVARRNSSQLDIRVDFVGLNFLDAAQQKQLPIVDIIVSNPPYIPLKDKVQMSANVVAYEPHIALFVPDDDPLIFYKFIARFGQERLYSDGCIYVEIEEGSGNEVVEVFKAAGYKKVEMKKDMQGKNRMVKIKMTDDRSVVR